MKISTSITGLMVLASAAGASIVVPAGLPEGHYIITPVDENSNQSVAEDHPIAELYQGDASKFGNHNGTHNNHANSTPRFTNPKDSPPRSIPDGSDGRRNRTGKLSRLQSRKFGKFENHVPVCTGHMWPMDVKTFDSAAKKFEEAYCNGGGNGGEQHQIGPGEARAVVWNDAVHYYCNAAMSYAWIKCHEDEFHMAMAEIDNGCNVSGLGWVKAEWDKKKDQNKRAFGRAKAGDEICPGLKIKTLETIYMP